MNTPQIKSPEGFCRVSEITKNNSDQNALYDAVACKQIPHARLGTGHSSIVFVHRESALSIVAKREHRRSAPPVLVPAESAQPAKSAVNQESTGGGIETLISAQQETNRLLGELLKIWGCVK